MGSGRCLSFPFRLASDLAEWDGIDGGAFMGGRGGGVFRPDDLLVAEGVGAGFFFPNQLHSWCRNTKVTGLADLWETRVLFVHF